MARAIPTPIHITPCACGADRVTEPLDGISIEYVCDACGELVADVIIGAEP